MDLAEGDETLRSCTMAIRKDVEIRLIFTLCVESA